MILRNFYLISLLIICYKIPNIIADDSDEGMTTTSAPISKYWQSIEKISQLLDAIKEFYSNQEQRTTKIIETKNVFAIGYENFNNIEFTAPKSFFSKLALAAHASDISQPVDNWWAHLNDIPNDEVHNRLNGVGVGNYSMLIENIVQKFIALKESIVAAKQWYEFLVTLHGILLEYDDSADVEKLVAQCSVVDGEINIRKMTELGNLVARINNTALDALYANFSDVAVADTPKLNALKTVFSQSIQSFPQCLENDRLLVTGYVVKISDVIANAKCWHKAKLIQIFALHAVIIDADVDKSGQMAIIAIFAPTWRVISKFPNERVINLVGNNGRSHNHPTAGKGTSNEDGKSGLPGLPGGSGGHFVGFGTDFKHTNTLAIDAVGGDGGPGQNGGDGSYSSFLVEKTKKNDSPMEGRTV